MLVQSIHTSFIFLCVYLKADRTVYHYCEHCRKAWSRSGDHPDHHGDGIDFHGIFLMSDFVSKTEEENIEKEIYRTPFVDSQSGRRKQVYSKVGREIPVVGIPSGNYR